MALFEESQQVIGDSERVLLCFIDIYHQDQHYQEFIDLSHSTGVKVVEYWHIKRQSINQKYLIGQGKVIQIKQFVSENDIEIVIFSRNLSAPQQRNLETAIDCRVMDRTGLILDIFALRAHSFEGKLQVELAQLKHLSTRLIRGWTHLERQKGGAGLRGPGETQLETDRRLVASRINHLKKRLKKLDNSRQLSRKSRHKNEVPVISLVGYTNAGKSSLFNGLTQSNIYTDDKLFATLDTTLRRITLPALGEVILADTVGFIQDLPPDLITAFKSTLDEVKNADVLLHVVDVNDENHLVKINQVEKVLANIGVNEIPTILVFNKIDQVDDDLTKKNTQATQLEKKVWVSAKTKSGLTSLKEAITHCLSQMMQTTWVKLKPQGAKLRSDIYQVGYIKSEKVDDYGHWILEIQVTNHYLGKLLRNPNIQLWPVVKAAPH